MKDLLIAFILLNLTATGFSSNWPARVFAPYMYIGADDNFKIARCAEVCGQKFYTIAFIIANQRLGPAWYGRIPMDKNLYADQIHTIRQQGGDVIVSFGGADGTELAIAETNAPLLEAKYQSVIDQYKFSWLDFDIEGDALSNQSANVRRNLVLTRLQAKNPELIISFTLPVDPDGISVESRALLADAKAKGLKVHSVNVMTMDFGAHFSKGRRMSDVSIVSTIKAHEQCQSIDPAMQIGVTPMIGQNDEHGEIFAQEDARALIKWAQAQPWVCSLSFWASNRDAGQSGKKGTDNHTSGIEQKPWEFTSIFKPFTTAY
jgi:hypothetical protein